MIRSRSVALLTIGGLLWTACAGGASTTTAPPTTSTTQASATTTTEAAPTTATTQPTTTSQAATTTTPPSEPDDQTPGVLSVHDLAGAAVEDPFFGSGFHVVDWADSTEAYLVSADSLTGGSLDFLAIAPLDPPPTITGLADGQILLMAWVAEPSGDGLGAAPVLFVETAQGWAADVVIDTSSLDEALGNTTDYRAVRPGGADAIDVVLERFDAGGVFVARVEAFIGGASFYEGEVECTIAAPMACTTLSDDGILRIEDEGEDVEALQENLIATGYLEGPADGEFGSATRAAVTAFQIDYRLTADGQAGPETLDVLEQVVNGIYPFLVASDRGVGYVPLGTHWEDALDILTSGLGAPSDDTGWYVDACDGQNWLQVGWGGFRAIFTDRSGSRIFDGWRVEDLGTVPQTLLLAHGVSSAWTWSDLAARGAEWEPLYGGVWRIAAWGFQAGRLIGDQPDPPDPGARIQGFGAGTGGFASC